LTLGTFNTVHFQKLLHFDDLDEEDYANVKGNVSAMVQIGSVGGALLAFVLADRIGRLWATRQLCALWIIGIVIFLTNNGRLGQVYAGRFIAGLGIGIYSCHIVVDKADTNQDKPPLSRLCTFQKLLQRL
jgi:MFS family permease